MKKQECIAVEALNLLLSPVFTKTGVTVIVIFAGLALIRVISLLLFGFPIGNPHSFLAYCLLFFDIAVLGSVHFLALYIARTFGSGWLGWPIAVVCYPIIAALVVLPILWFLSLPRLLERIISVVIYLSGLAVANFIGGMFVFTGRFSY